MSGALFSESFDTQLTEVEALQTKYTKFSAGHNGDMLSMVIRKNLSQNLARLVPQLKDELEAIVATEFPECKGTNFPSFPCLSPSHRHPTLSLFSSQLTKLP